jgi:hypothetical protein
MEVTQTDVGPDNAGTGKAVTVIVTVFEVAGFPDGQLALEVKIQVIASVFTGV